MDNIAQTTDQRHAPRRRVLKSARILYGNGLSIDCTVREISETGARLVLSGPLALPHKFQLLVLSENLLRPAQIAWKLDNVIGVAFTGPAEPMQHRPASRRNATDQSTCY